MYAPHGETPGSSSPPNKDGEGIKTGRHKGIQHGLKYLTIIIPNYKARHRSKGDGIQWGYEWAYLQNRYYVKYRPLIRVIMKKLKLRK